MPATVRFEQGRIYEMHWVTDHTLRTPRQVVARTPKTVTIRERAGGPTATRRIAVVDGVERCMPLGRYSMAPVLAADRPTRP
jgi:hypothetical protein